MLMVWVIQCDVFGVIEVFFDVGVKDLDEGFCIVLLWVMEYGYFVVVRMFFVKGVDLEIVRDRIFFVEVMGRVDLVKEFLDVLYLCGFYMQQSVSRG